MATRHDTIVFTYELKQSLLSIELIADIDKLGDEEYLVKNICKSHAGSGNVIPPLVLQKSHGIWVHKDSRKETELSSAIGKAIDVSKESGKPTGKTV